jgi:hypothetical protein
VAKVEGREPDVGTPKIVSPYVPFREIRMFSTWDHSFEFKVSAHEYGWEL